LKVAIVCSWLNQYGGAERVLEVVHALYPEAPVYTSIFRPDTLPPAYRGWDVRPSLLNRLPGARGRHHQWLLPLYPYAFEHMDLSSYDLVLSVTSAFAHGVHTSPHALHICYCLTPARFLWDYNTYVARENLGRAARSVLPLLIRSLRRWDRQAAGRVSQFVGISKTVQQRISQFYGRYAEIIYPPTDVQRFQPAQSHEDYFLIISRLVPYKRIDLAVQAFNRLGLPLVIIGDGRDRPALEALAAPNVRFLGRLDDDQAAPYLAGCRAFLFPGQEDFGIAPIEAQAAGRPVIAYAGGGALETIVEGTTGIFFREQTPESLADAVMRFRDDDFDPQAIHQQVLRFDRQEFVRRFGEFVRTKYDESA